MLFYRTRRIGSRPSYHWDVPWNIWTRRLYCSGLVLCETYGTIRSQTSFHFGRVGFCPDICDVPSDQSFRSSPWYVVDHMGASSIAALAGGHYGRGFWVCIDLPLTSSVPNKRSLGSVNGLAQTMVSMARMIGPATATSLFAYST